jgi:hypothetical protein
MVARSLLNAETRLSHPPTAKKGEIVRYDGKYLINRRIVVDKFLNALVNIPEIAAGLLFGNRKSLRSSRNSTKSYTLPHWQR